MRLRRFRHNMDNLNNLMGHYSQPEGVQRRVREYLHRSRHLLC